MEIITFLRLSARSSSRKLKPKAATLLVERTIFAGSDSLKGLVVCSHLTIDQ